MEKVKSISLLCENLSDITLESSDLYVFHMKGLSGEVMNTGDGFEVCDVCDCVFMSIKRDANKILEHPFGKYGSLFNMLNTDHCVSGIRVTMEDDESEEETIVYVPWDGELENEHMDTQITEDGDLLMVISKEDTVASVFGINDCGCCCH